jgi:hypothetical protein
MEFGAPLLKNYVSELNGILANGGCCLPCLISKWGEDPMVSLQFSCLFSRPMTGRAGGVV